MKWTSLMLIGAVALQACSSETPDGKETEPSSDTIAAEQVTDNEDPEKTRDPNIRVFDFPATISDENLDRYFDEKTAKTLSEEQEKEYAIDRLENTKGSDYYVLGEFNLSDRFSSRLILRNSNWTETVGWLANYDPAGKLIDYLEVFYSDNVEGYRSIASRISSEGITVTTDRYDYSGEEEKVVTTKTLYRIEANGKFTNK